MRNGMWHKLKDGYRKFVRDTPGQRFMNFHRRWHQQVKGPGPSVGMVVIGLILIALGIVLGFVPGIPGFVLFLPGLAMIAAPFGTPAEWLDRAEVAIRRIWKRFRRRP